MRGGRSLRPAPRRLLSSSFASKDLDLIEKLTFRKDFAWDWGETCSFLERLHLFDREETADTLAMHDVCLILNGMACARRLDKDLVAVLMPRICSNLVGSPAAFIS